MNNRKQTAQAKPRSASRRSTPNAPKPTGDAGMDGLGALLAASMTSGQGVQITLEPKITGDGPKVMMRVESLDAVQRRRRAEDDALVNEPAPRSGIAVGLDLSETALERSLSNGRTGGAAGHAVDPARPIGLSSVIDALDADIDYANKLLGSFTQLANRLVGTHPESLAEAAHAEITANCHVGALSQRQNQLRIVLARINDQLTRIESVA